MPLSFHTHQQQMVFVNQPSALDPTPHIQDPSNLVGGTSYDVFIVVENSDNVERTAVVTVTHSAFGIGLPGGVITPPDPVTVPPQAYGIPGLATMRFTFTAPPGGHGCLVATLQSTGALLQQNVTATGCPVGTNSLLSFLVFGGAADETMHLDLREFRLVGTTRTLVTPAQSWQPLLIAPPGTGSPPDLHLAAHGFYSVGLRVTIPVGATQTHVFHIVGTVNGQYVGEVDIIVNPQSGPPLPLPDPYVVGGYQSSDIILRDRTTHAPIDLGGMPGGSWDTILAPDTDYEFLARVHNGAPTPAVNTVVRFWRIPGGLVAGGILVDVQSCTVPGNGFVDVQATNWFRSAPTGQHSCAAVSISNSQSASFQTDATTAADIPPPTIDVAHSQAGWRNTDSMFVFLGQPWQFVVEAGLALAFPQPDPGPIEIRLDVAALYVSADWEKAPEVARLTQTIREAGGPNNSSLFLLSELRKSLKAIDLGIEIKAQDGKTEIKRSTDKQKGLTQYLIPASAGKTVPLILTGQVPAQTQANDRLVVRLSARYPQTKTAPERIVEFTEILYVRKK